MNGVWTVPEHLLSNWFLDVTAHLLRLRPDDINAEALGNLWTFALNPQQAAEIAPDKVEQFILDVVEAWRRQLTERHVARMVFYCWHDSQAGQLRFSAVSASHGRLPFACHLERVAELSVVVTDWLQSPYLDGVAWTELNHDQGACGEASNFVQTLWVTRLN